MGGDAMSATINASLVAGGVGLPDLWKCKSALVPGCGGPVIASRGSLCTMAWVGPETIQPWEIEENVLAAALDVCLDDPQTAFGVALRLDGWERARGNMIVWSADLAAMLNFGRDDGRLADFLQRLAARLTRIGQDHLVRRAFGERPKPGTLAGFGLMQPHGQWWRFDAREHGGAFIEWDRWGAFIGSAGVEGGAPNVPELSGCERCVRAGGVCMRCKDDPAHAAAAALYDPTEALAVIYEQVVG